MKLFSFFVKYMLTLDVMSKIITFVLFSKRNCFVKLTMLFLLESMHHFGPLISKAKKKHTHTKNRFRYINKNEEFIFF